MDEAVEARGAGETLRIGILTISDRCASGLREDLSGPAIRKVAAERGLIVSVYACIPDERRKISQTLKHWADDHLCDCILTTGGTGLSERDMTPEATQRVLERELLHLAAQIALQGVKEAPNAVLSRGVAGTRGHTLIVNLPGSPGGAADGAKIALAIARHAVDVLREQGDQAHERPRRGKTDPDQ